jgi:hypothetical protein
MLAAEAVSHGDLVEFFDEVLDILGEQDPLRRLLGQVAADFDDRGLLGGLVDPDGDGSVGGRPLFDQSAQDLRGDLGIVPPGGKELAEEGGQAFFLFRIGQFFHEVVFEDTYIGQRQEAKDLDPFGIGLIEDDPLLGQGRGLLQNDLFRHSAALFQLLQALGTFFFEGQNEIELVLPDQCFDDFHQHCIRFPTADGGRRLSVSFVRLHKNPLFFLNYAFIIFNLN